MRVHCFAGCDWREVRKAFGLDEEVRERRREIARYVYESAAGDPLYAVIRYEPKSFAMITWENGKWVRRGPDVRVLYQLPLIVKRQGVPVVFCEGEKDALAITGERAVGTCIAGGAKAKWEPQFALPLAGRDVVVVADNDIPGLDFAARVACRLVGVARAVRLVRFDGMPQGFDLSDYLVQRKNIHRERLGELQVVWYGRKTHDVCAM